VVVVGAVRRLRGFAAACVLAGALAGAATPAAAATYPPSTPVPSVGSVTEQDTPRTGPRVTVNSHVDVLGLQLPRTGVQAAGWAGVGLLLVGGGTAMSVSARRTRH
jgi:hypothetical protein